jgi:hypothetical protein
MVSRHVRLECVLLLLLREKHSIYEGTHACSTRSSGHALLEEYSNAELIICDLSDLEMIRTGAKVRLRITDR